MEEKKKKEQEAKEKAKEDKEEQEHEANFRSKVRVVSLCLLHPQFAYFHVVGH